MKKKKVMLLIVIITVIIGLGIGCVVYRDLNKDFIYTELEDGTLELTEYRGNDTVITIPAEINGKKVTVIGRQCFYEYEITGYQVDIPNTVVSIGEASFYGGKELTITGGESVEYIGDSAFNKCVFSKKFPFSDKLINIGNYAFYSANVKEVKLSSTLKFIGVCAFQWSDIEELTVPQSVTYIGAHAFDETEWIEKQEGYIIVGDNILIKMPEEENVVVPNGWSSVKI